MHVHSNARISNEPRSAALHASEGPVARDPLRERLLDAAARLIARQGYNGLTIQQIVKAAGLSAGAIYGRFSNKEELVREAIITRSVPQEPPADHRDIKISDLIVRSSAALLREPGISEQDTLLLEAYVTAGRDPVIAGALAEAHQRWRRAVQPDVEAATLDGTLADAVDPQAVLFLTRILRLGLLLHRRSGLPDPDQDSWEHLMQLVVASFGPQLG
jgi:AcrR family transcriptional regulator